MCSDICSDMCSDMCSDICSHMFSDLCSDMCFDMCGQVEKGWSTKDVRQWAQRIGLLGASLSLIACGFMKQPGN